MENLETHRTAFRRVMEGIIVGDDYNPLVKFLGGYTARDPFGSFSSSSRHPRWGDWEYWLDPDPSGNGAAWIYVRGQIKPAQKDCAGNEVGSDIARKAYLIRLEGPRAWILDRDAVYYPVHPLSPGSAASLQATLAADAKRFGSRTALLTPRFVWGEESIVPVASSATVRGVRFSVIPENGMTRVSHRAGSFWTRSRVILPDKFPPKWAGEEAVGLELCEGLLLIFPDGSIRFVSRWEERLGEFPLPAFRQGDLLVFPKGNALEEEHPGGRGPDLLDRHKVEGAVKVGWETVSFDHRIQVASFQGPARVSHPEHEHLEVPEGEWIAFLAPGTSRPFQRGDGAD